MTDGLSEVDKRRLKSVHSEWVRSRDNRDFRRADRLRGYLENAGCLGPDYAMWHPVFEEPAHRQRRLKDRAK